MNTAKILKFIALSGVATTVYLTIKATPHAESHYEEYVMTKNFDPNNTDATKRFVGQVICDYNKAFISAGVTVAAILLLDEHHNKAEKALLASLYLAKTQLEDLHEEIPFDYSIGNDIPKTKKDEILVYEPYTDQLFPTTMKLIEKAENKLNKRLNQFYTVKLNRFVKDIGGRACSFGDTIGWAVTNEMQMDIWNTTDGPYEKIILKSQDQDGRRIYIIDYDVKPLWI